MTEELKELQNCYYNLWLSIQMNLIFFLFLNLVNRQFNNLKAYISCKYCGLLDLSVYPLVLYSDEVLKQTWKMVSLGDQRYSRSAHVLQWKGNVA